MNKRNRLNLMIVGFMVVMVTGCSNQSAEKAVDQVKEGAKAVTDKTGEIAKDAKEGAKAVADKTGEIAKDAAEGTKEAVATATNWTKEKMEEYLGKMGEQLSGFNDEFKDLEAKAEGLTGAAKEKFDEQMATLTEKKDSADKEMETLKNASGDAWTTVKERFEAIMKEIKELYDSMIAELAGN